MCIQGCIAKCMHSALPGNALHAYIVSKKFLSSITKAGLKRERTSQLNEWLEGVKWELGFAWFCFVCFFCFFHWESGIWVTGNEDHKQKNNEKWEWDWDLGKNWTGRMGFGQTLGWEMGFVNPLPPPPLPLPWRPFMTLFNGIYSAATIWILPCSLSPSSACL